MAMHLPIGYKLKFNNRPGVYTVVKILGRGASTIAYLTSYENEAGRLSDRILKEFCPQSIQIERDEFGTLSLSANQHEEFSRSLELFKAGGNRQNELRNKTRLRNETPPLLEILYANNTAYLEVTPFEGRTYDNLSSFTLLERMKICLTVAKLVRQYHAEGYLCLDIKPDNIFVLTNSANEVVTDMVEFIDFDSVRKKTEISFGNSLSFTETWAAPEQISVHGVRRISEATDAYTIGEMVFWSVFERHSTVDEHRSFSTYPFGDAPESFAVQLGRHDVQTVLSRLFQKTIRSSSRNRFQGVQSIIDLLTELCDLLSIKEYIINSEVHPNEFFVGRAREYQELTARIDTERLIFLCGIGGIGKSEIAKQYAINNRKKYSSILYFSYTGDFEETICQDTVTIATLERFEDESNHYYCWRKLHAIKRCLHKNSLIIIDNMNSRLEDVEHLPVWEFLRSLPCEIIVTTRAEQAEHMLRIEEIEDINALRSIFQRNCPYSDEYESYVDEIILLLNRHTLLTELIAKQTRVAMCTPQEMLDRLQANGIHGLNRETVKMIKDDHLSRETVYYHTRKLFTMSAMTFEQHQILTKAAFMPETGVMASDFLGYHAIDNNDTINWLVDNGWLYCSTDGNFTLSIHPVIAEIVIEGLKSTPDLLQNFYENAMAALPWKSQAISHKAHDQLCKAIATITMRNSIVARPATVYLIRHAGHPAIRSSRDATLAQLKYAISTLDREKSSKQYSAILEYAHLYLIRAEASPNNLNESIAICKQHLKLTKNARDFYLTAKFGCQLSRFYLKKLDSKDGSFSDLLRYIFYYFYGLFYWNKLAKDLSKKAPRYTSKQRLQNELDYDYLVDYLANVNNTIYLEIAGDLESMDSEVFFCSKPSSMEIQNLQRAMNFRQLQFRDRTLNTSLNSIEIVVDKARILYLQGDYEGARITLQPIVEMYNSKGLLPDGSLFRIHQFLGNIAATTGDYATAVIELRHCLEIGKELQLNETFLADVQFGRFLNEAGNITESEIWNIDVLSRLEHLDAETRKSFYADALYNYASLLFLKKDPNGAIKTYIKAYNEYCQCTGPSEFSKIGRARCCRKLFEIYYKYGKHEKAEQEFKLAKEKYIDCLGETHPEVQEFLRRSPIK